MNGSCWHWHPHCLCCSTHSYTVILSKVWYEFLLFLSAYQSHIIFRCSRRVVLCSLASGNTPCTSYSHMANQGKMWTLEKESQAFQGWDQLHIYLSHSHNSRWWSEKLLAAGIAGFFFPSCQHTFCLMRCKAQRMNLEFWALLVYLNPFSAFRVFLRLQGGEKHWSSEANISQPFTTLLPICIPCKSSCFHMSTVPFPGWRHSINGLCLIRLFAVWLF